MEDREIEARFLMLKLKDKVEKRGFNILKEWENDRVIGINFMNKKLFNILKTITDEKSAYYELLSSCTIDKKNLTLECKIRSTVLNPIEFYIRCPKEDKWFRPHFIPKDRVAAIDVSLPARDESIDEIGEILDSFMFAQGIIRD